MAAGEDERIVGRDVEEQRVRGAAAQQGEHDARADAQDQQKRRFAEDDVGDVGPRGAKRETHADLAGPAGDGVGDHAVEADDRQEGCERAEPARQRRQELLAQQRVANVGRHDGVHDRDPRIDLAERGRQGAA